MLSRASAAAARVTRLATAAVAVRPAAWARTGPAAAPARVAAASPVRKTAPIRPRTALGIARCMVVCGTTRDMEPNAPTAALTRLAEALGLRLVVTLAPEEGAGASVAAEVPASLVRLGRTGRFRAAVAVMALALGVSPDEFSGQLVAALAALAQAMGRDLAEADWWRLLDALMLVAAHPASG